jgi:hypothetical protein
MALVSVMPEVPRIAVMNVMTMKALKFVMSTCKLRTHYYTFFLNVPTFSPEPGFLVILCVWRKLLWFDQNLW